MFDAAHDSVMKRSWGLKRKIYEVGLSRSFACSPWSYQT